MKNSIKKIFALFLAIVMASGSICVGVTVRAQGVAQEKEQMDDLEEQADDTQNAAGTHNLPEYDIWMAQTMIHGFDNDGNGLYPMFQSFSDPVYRQLGGYLLDYKPLIAISAAWSVYFNSTYRNHFKNEQKYIYEVLLMDYLKYDAQSNNVSVQYENNETKFSMKLYSLISKELSNNTFDYIGEMTVEEAVKFYDNIKIADNFRIAISEVKDGAKSVKDLINMASEYMALQQVKEERIYLLKEARDACEESDSSNSDFIKAADEVIDILQQTKLEYIQGKSIDYLLGKVWDVSWEVLCKKNPVLSGIELGVSGLDVCFNTTDRASNNLKLALLYTTDCYMKLGMMNAASDFMSNDTDINGRTFLAAFQGYIQFQMYGNDFAKTWLEDYLDGGAIAGAVNRIFHEENIQSANDLLALSNSQTQNREKLLELIDKYAGIYQNLKEKEEEPEDVVRDIVLVLDRSGSMVGDPLEQTKAAALNFLDTVFENEEASRISVVTYDTTASVNCKLTADKQKLTSCIENIYSGDMTNMYAGLGEADQLLANSKAEKKIIVLMSDGLPNEGVSDSYDYSAPLLRYASEMKEKGYYIYTLGFFMALGNDELYSAQQLMEGIASPGLHYEVQSADDLIFFFEDIANQISGTQYVYIRIACPVDVTVSSDGDTLSSKSDSENTRTSFGTLTYENIQNEEDGSLSEDRVKILRLNMEKDYDVEIEGYGNGTMNYTVSFPNESGEYDDVREFPDIEVTDVTKAASNTSASDATYLEVDKNGDGKTDITYKTEANGKMEEVKDHTVLYIVLAASVTFAVILLILVIVLVRVSKKKKKSAWPVNAAGAVCGAFGIYQGKRYPIGPGGKCVVGRKTTCDIQLVHGQVSRVHCVIEMLPDGVYQVTDYSSNGTFYNDQKLKSKQPYRLPKGALLAIGDADNILELR